MTWWGVLAVRGESRFWILCERSPCGPSYDGDGGEADCRITERVRPGASNGLDVHGRAVRLDPAIGERRPVVRRASRGRGRGSSRPAKRCRCTRDADRQRRRWIRPDYMRGVWMCGHRPARRSRTDGPVPSVRWRGCVCGVAASSR